MFYKVYKVTGLNYIFMTISLQQKLMEMDTATEVLTTKKLKENSWLEIKGSIYF